MLNPPILISLRSSRRAATIVLALLTLLGGFAAASRASSLRRTAVVRAVQSSRPSIVSVYGHKTVREQDSNTGASTAREVNGMGTGVVIDERGYIITNHHVVDGVRKIRVTLVDGSTLSARLIAQDAKSDLAVLKVDPREKLPVIHIGTSSDLMTGETVIAVGNAYGYENTVTKGIISALHRTVQVSDTQSYRDLIQTDASINQGNSGGPLLNVDGEMIGINVAVRAGAQGIGFAIPVDKAMHVAATMMSTERIAQTWHGIVAVGRAARGESAPGIRIERIDSESPADKGKLQPGDVITKVDDVSMDRPLDLERALLDRRAGEKAQFDILRDGETKSIVVVMAESPKRAAVGVDRNWSVLGMKLVSVDPTEVRQRTTRYRGGLRVAAVRPAGPAWRQGIRKDDILVGMHVWETVSLDNVQYILDRPDFVDLAPVKFYILRGSKTLYGHLPASLAENE